MSFIPKKKKFKTFIYYPMQGKPTYFVQVHIYIYIVSIQYYPFGKVLTRTEGLQRSI